MSKLYMHLLGDFASSMYRQRLPARHVRVPGLEVKCDYVLDNLNYHSYWFPLLVNPAFMPVIEHQKRWGKRIVWETDDDLWRIPDWNPASRVYNFQAVETINWVAKLADDIVVSTEALRMAVANATQSLGDFLDKIHVCPNLVDLDAWPELPPREPGPVRILWAGSQHHDRDLQEFVPALERIIEEFGEKVMVYFLGDWPSDMAEWARIRHTHLSCQIPRPKYLGRLGFINAVSLAEYPRTLCTIRPDIALAPLTMEYFNNSKSGIKWYECAMAGAAMIATDLPPYQEIRDGEDGLLVHPNDRGREECSNRWYESIKKLIEDRPLREYMAFKARRRVIEEFSWQNGPGKQKWEAFFRRLAE